MRFAETPLPGAFVVEPDRIEDERGFFARTWCAREFARRGLAAQWAQCSISLNKRRGTLRGMHYQVPPHAETKLVRCTAGAVHDVIIDLRRESPTYLGHTSALLSAENRRALYIPEGFAHGFQTLADDTEVFYEISAFYEPEAARCVRWNDPAFGIRWPIPDPIMSSRDREAPDFA